MAATSTGRSGAERPTPGRRVLHGHAGGLSDAMRDINLRSLASRVPVIIYVDADGARAGRPACTSLCRPLVAMAPATNIGSATPVARHNGGEAQMSPEMRAKVTNDASLAFGAGRTARRDPTCRAPSAKARTCRPAKRSRQRRQLRRHRPARSPATGDGARVARRLRRRHAAHRRRADSRRPTCRRSSRSC